MRRHPPIPPTLVLFGTARSSCLPESAMHDRPTCHISTAVLEILHISLIYRIDGLHNTRQRKKNARSRQQQQQYTHAPHASATDDNIIIRRTTQHNNATASCRETHQTNININVNKTYIYMYVYAHRYMPRAEIFLPGCQVVWGSAEKLEDPVNGVRDLTTA